MDTCTSSKGMEAELRCQFHVEKAIHMPIRCVLSVLLKRVAVVELVQIFPPVSVCKGSNYSSWSCQFRWKDAIANAHKRLASLNNNRLPTCFRFILKWNARWGPCSVVSGEDQYPEIMWSLGGVEKVKLTDGVLIIPLHDICSSFWSTDAQKHVSYATQPSKDGDLLSFSVANSRLSAASAVRFFSNEVLIQHVVLFKDLWSQLDKWKIVIT